MADVKYNKETNKAVRLDNNQWVDTPVKTNEETGESVAFDGVGWSSVGGVDYQSQISGMDEQDISVARSKNNPLGDYLRQQTSQPVAGETEQETFKRQYGGLPMPERPGMAEGMARAYLQGGTFAGGDEIVAGGAAALDSLIRGDNFSDAYDVRRTQERNKLKQFREDNPVAAYGTEIAGAIPTALLPQANLMRTLKGSKYGVQGAIKTPLFNNRYLQASGIGTLQGGAYGFGQGEGDALDQAKSAGMGAALGGTFGLAGVPVSKGIANLAERYATRQAAKKANLSGPAYQILDRGLQADDALYGAGAKRIEDAGEDAMLADAGSGAQRLLDTAIVESPPAARLATEAVERRATEAGRKINTVLDDTLGAPVGTNLAARNIAEGTRQARADSYELAYSKPINYASDAGRNIEATLARVPDRVMDAAIAKANERMVAKGLQNQQILADVAKDGKVTFIEMPNVEQLDQIKRALGEMGAEAIDTFGRKTSDGTMYSNLAREIKNATSNAVREYGVAVRLGGDKIERDTALRLGTEILKSNVTRENVADAVKDMSDHARQEAATGLRSNIDNILANVKIAMTDTNVDAREAFKFIQDMSSRANREKVKLLLGEDASQVIFKQLDESMKAFELKASVARNSATAVRRSTSQGVDKIVEGGAINQLRSGQVVDAPKSMIAAILGRSEEAKQQIKDDVYIEMVKALTGPRGAEARQALEHLQTVQPLIDQSTGKIMDITQTMFSRNAPVTSTMQDALGAR